MASWVENIRVVLNGVISIVLRISDSWECFKGKAKARAGAVQQKAATVLGHVNLGRISDAIGR